MSLPRLPLDIFRVIVETVADMKESEELSTKITDSRLFNLSLTCRFLYKITRPHLFKTILIRSQARCGGLQEILSLNPSLSIHIKNATFEAEKTGDIWLASDCGRSLMRLLSRAIALQFVHLNYISLDPENLGWPGSTMLSSITTLELAWSVITHRTIFDVLQYTPRLENLYVEDSCTTSDENRDALCSPITSSSTTSPGISDLHICRSSFDNEAVLDQFVTTLRRSGRCQSLRSATLWFARPWCRGSFWPFLLESASSLEELSIVLFDPTNSFESQPAIEAMHAPRLSVLHLQLGDFDYRSFFPSTLTSCLNIISSIHPSDERFALEIEMYVPTSLLEATRAMLAQLDVMLGPESSVFKGFHALTLDVRCGLRKGETAITSADFQNCMPMVDKRSRLVCKIENEVWDISKD
jgi:hypothetical protein